MRRPAITGKCEVLVECRDHAIEEMLRSHSIFRSKLISRSVIFVNRLVGKKINDTVEVMA